MSKIYYNYNKSLKLMYKAIRFKLVFKNALFYRFLNFFFKKGLKYKAGMMFVKIFLSIKIRLLKSSKVSFLVSASDADKFKKKNKIFLKKIRHSLIFGNIHYNMLQSILLELNLKQKCLFFDTTKKIYFEK